LNNIIKNSEEQKVELEKYKSLNFNGVLEERYESPNINLINEKFVQNFKEVSNTLAKDYVNFLLVIENRKSFINKINNMVNSFKFAYKKTIEEIKRNDFQGVGLKAYERQAQDYFKKLAHEIFQQKKIFEELINNDVVLNFENDELNNQTNNSLLSYKIDSMVTLDQDKIVDILKIVLPTPGGSISDISK
jgi:hypothetical protein